MMMVFGLLAARGDSGSKPYLKVTGPPPLRFEYVAENDAQFLALLTLPKQQESPITNMPPPKPESEKAETYTSGAMQSPVISASAYPYGLFSFGGFPYGMPPYGMPPWGAPPMGAYGSYPTAVPTMPAGVPGNSASNMLSVNPQMINDYFKSNPTGATGATQYQPGDTITVPQELGFVPPANAPSQSSYTSK